MKNGREETAPSLVKNGRLPILAPKTTAVVSIMEATSDYTVKRLF